MSLRNYVGIVVSDLGCAAISHSAKVAGAPDVIMATSERALLNAEREHGRWGGCVYKRLGDIHHVATREKADEFARQLLGPDEPAPQPPIQKRVSSTPAANSERTEGVTMSNKPPKPEATTLTEDEKAVCEAFGLTPERFKLLGNAASMSLDGKTIVTSNGSVRQVPRRG